MSHEEMVRKIEEILDQVRPNIQMDGGDLEFVNFENSIVYIRLKGACVGCPASIFTLKLGIEEALKEHLSDVQEVIAID